MRKISVTPISIGVKVNRSSRRPQFLGENMKMYIGLAIILLLMFGCTNPGGNNQQNSTNTTLTKTIAAELGDNVSVNYQLYVDGKLLDTNNATLANQSGIFNGLRIYQPLTFAVQLNGQLIPGFVGNIIGMKINETKNFTVDPALGYGPIDPNKTITVPRFYNKSLYENVSRAYMESQGLNISNGTAYNTPQGTVFISSFDKDNVTLFYVLHPGDEFKVNGVPEKVLALNNFTAYIEYNFQYNQTYQIPDPNTGTTTQYRLTNQTNTTLTLDGNSPLAGKTLNFVVTLLDIQKQTTQN